MEYKVPFSDDALRDIEETLEFIRADKPLVSEEFAIALLNHVDLSAAFPYIGAVVPRRPGVRKLLHTPTRIYYRIHEDKKLVEMLRLGHGSGRLPR